MSIADKYRPQFTYDDYVLWEGRWELIDGMPYAMSPATAVYHQRVNLNLLAVFNDALKKSCEECLGYMPIDWKINEKTVVQPDVSIVCGKADKEYLDFTPALVIEILSPSTAYKDRHEKFELYEEQGVKYYLIIDPQFKKMEIYELIGKKYQPVSITPSQFEFSLQNDCRFSVGFDGIWD
ncbi:MAG: Uma2 family endonuclease [Chitinophagaceae bacterium]|nr:Uma2 family endonuclease [Chitinophagaceae bacterium]